ncbi:MAG: UDP-3-O-acyl-N-acetylglucosamine deacetylase [Desulfomonile sp.]|nr:UDP-3-O-acyl-N-acetylglucosamine deacetylase [Desulfomonile sp.]
MEKGRILIVDDQDEILNSFEGILTDEGYEVLLARDGQEALHIVQSDTPDVVFLDIWIPGIDGMQTLKAIKRIDPDCSVIMMSGHGTIETAVQAIKMGAADYLEKPVRLEDVLHLVEKAVAARGTAAAGNGSNGPAPGLLVGASDKALRLRAALADCAAVPGSVWLVGEEGTGKEFAARIIHHLEGKDRSSLVKLRCSELDEQTCDETFARKLDALNRQLQGKRSKAAGSTLQLIRVDRLHPNVRTGVLRLVADLVSSSGSGVFPDARVGRIVSTSSYDPQVLVTEKGFPGELVEVLAHRVIRVPPLRERIDDIPVYAEHFLKEAAEEFDKEITGIDEEAMSKLTQYSWPGNVKELKILIEHVVMTAPGPVITAVDLLIPGAAPVQSARSVSVPSKLESNPATTRKEQRSRTQVSSAGTIYQKTLRGRVVMYGQGLHSGIKTGLTLSPLPPGSGILFGHITSAGTVPAVLTNVESTELATCLRSNGTYAKTIEHLMAVFHVYGLTNVLVKISGEVPIMDGSAVEFCDLVENAEIIGQDELVEEVRIEEVFELNGPAGSTKSMRVEPADRFEVEYFLDYPPPVGSMHFHYRLDGPEDFKREIAPARTFGFVRDMRVLDEMGLAGGGRLSNLVLIDEDKVVNPPLRFPDEFVRHKVLDVIGDFYLLGRPFRGKIIARQTGHSDNIAMLRMINEKMKIV